jgi:hypothetical protein
MRHSAFRPAPAVGEVAGCPHPRELQECGIGGDAVKDTQREMVGVLCYVRCVQKEP